MQGRHCVIAVLLATAHLAAGAAPCPPAGSIGKATPRDRSGVASSHGATAHGGTAHDAGAHHHAGDATQPADAVASDDARPCHEAPSVIARCPCGCDERGGAPVPGARLGRAVPAAAWATLSPAEGSAFPGPHPGLPDAAPASPDKVPIQPFLHVA